MLLCELTYYMIINYIICLSMEKFVETKICKCCWVHFDITDKDLEFYEKVSPIFPLSQPFPLREKGVEKNTPLDWGGKGGVIEFWNGKVKYLIPSPTLCPNCRQQRRLSFRNERKLYKRKCDASGKEVISIYSPDKPYKVYNQDFWWSDWWDAFYYWREFDFGKNFFEQFWELIKEVPKVNFHSHLSNENCPYTNYFVQSKNCYFCFWWGFCEDLYYSSFPVNCKDSMEIFFSTDCENCYEISHSKKCYNLKFSDNCDSCSNSYFLDSCNGCKNCFFCYWLDNKEYYIFNKKSTKEDFDKIIKNIFPFNEEIKREIEFFYEIYPVLYKHIVRSENCLWDYIYNSKNCTHCFNVENLEESKYCDMLIKETKIAYDYSFWIWINCEKILELLIGSMWLYNVLFSSIIRENCKNIFYSFDINNCSNLFWCIWLKNKSYCILNKQYTKEEYEKLVTKIIEHMSSPQPSPEGEGVREWGEFFPSSLSPFGYNETVAQEYFPLTKEEAIKKWFFWSDYETPFPKVEKIIPASKLPENISEIPDDILNWAIECEITKKPFRIIKQELEFYRKHNLPIPRRSPDQRHLERMALRNPRKLFRRICDKCGKKIQTTYTPERKEIVYCEECYNKEIY